VAYLGTERFGTAVLPGDDEGYEVPNGQKDDRPITVYRAKPTQDRRHSPGGGEAGPVRHRLAVRVLVAGGGFATTISTILGAVGLYRLGDTAIISSLVALCVIAALTMLTTAQTMRDVDRCRGPRRH
jgi:hypothetical protein